MCATSVGFILFTFRFDRTPHRLTTAMPSSLQRDAASRRGSQILSDYNDDLTRNAGALYQGDWARYWDPDKQRWWHSSPDKCEKQWEDEATPYTCTNSWRTWWLLTDGSWHWGPAPDMI